MIFLYTLLVSLLGMVKYLVGVRARALERKYVSLAGTVDQLVRQIDCKSGNGKVDPCLSAKRAFQLGQHVAERDRIETKHFSWQGWTERLTRWLNVLREWKGKKLPYTLGVLDVSMLLYAVDYAGAGEFLSAQNVIEVVKALFSN